MARIFTTTFSLTLLLAATAGSAASAEPAPAAQPPPVVLLVGVVPGTGQAILWDAGEKAYRVVKVGGEIRGARVVSITADRIIVSQGEMSLAVPLTPSPFALRPTTAGGKEGPPPVIVAPRRYSSPPPFLGNQPAAPAAPAAADEKQTPVPMPAAPAPETAPAPAAEMPRVEAKAAPTAAPAPSPGPAAAPAPSPALAPALASEPVVVSLMRLRAEVSEVLASRRAYSATLAGPGGILLDGVTEGSLPHRLGLRSGDRLVSLGGKTIKDTDSAADAYLSLLPGREVKLVVKRKGGEQETVKLRVQG